MRAGVGNLLQGIGALCLKGGAALVKLGLGVGKLGQAFVDGLLSVGKLGERRGPLCGELRLRSIEEPETALRGGEAGASIAFGCIERFEPGIDLGSGSLEASVDLCDRRVDLGEARGSLAHALGELGDCALFAPGGELLQLLLRLLKLRNYAC